VADGLATGALLALYCRRPGVGRSDILRTSLLCVASAVFLMAAGYPFGIFLSRTLLGGSLRGTMLNLLFAGTLGITLLIGTSRWKWLVRRPTLQFFGEISYGLYLTHVLVFEVFDHFATLYFPSLSDSAVPGHFVRILLRFALAGVASVALACLSRYTFEAAFLSLKDRWAAGTPRPALTSHTVGSKVA